MDDFETLNLAIECQRLICLSFVSLWPTTTFRCSAANRPQLRAKQKIAVSSSKLSGAKGRPSEPSALRKQRPLPSDEVKSAMTGGQTPLPSSLMRSRRVPWFNAKRVGNPIARFNSGTFSIRRVGVRPARPSEQ